MTGDGFVHLCVEKVRPVESLSVGRWRVWDEVNRKRKLNEARKKAE